MNHVRVTIEVQGEETAAVFVAILSDIGFEGFEELPKSLLGYIREEQFDLDAITTALEPFKVPFTYEPILFQNWNAVWESNFQPVVIEEFCTVSADFHRLQVATPFHITINPKMSFGTGHHATTQLMMQMMRDVNLQDQRVLDFGCGTGILSILASKMGARQVVAVDIEPWAVENAKEHAVINAVSNVLVCEGGLKAVPDKTYNVILANVNRHVLLACMGQMRELLTPDGAILMSGVLIEDQERMEEGARASGLHIAASRTLSGWLCLKFFLI